LELEDLFPGDYENHVADPWAWREHGGESLEDLRTRVLGVRDRILETHSELSAVALVSHMFPTRAILADALNLDLTEWSQLEIPTGSISLVEYEGTHGSVKFMGKHRLP
jgi:broad specificity phosphatase PhoE